MWFSKECIKHPFVKSHWIDGSFVTKKENPNDVDLSIRVVASEFNEYLSDGGTFLNGNCHDEIKSKYSCDSYLILDYPEHDPRHEGITVKRERYWIDFWGHTRDKEEKGFVQFDLCSEDHASDVINECERLGDIE
ncbi:MAG: hypothetical protein LBJ20_01300 [Candidatus Methanoplasma sp.]|jgi:hypothetical protein|nr:hypothetical protein [Candidatus Methanoplasma sp.]